MSNSNGIIHQPFVRTILLGCAVVFLAILSWWSLNGGIFQISRSQTFGQQAETTIQILCGVLSVIVVITSFRFRKWAKSVRIAWGISFALVGGLSPLVWGPPMPLISLFFVGVASLIAWAVIWALRTALNAASKNLR